MYPTVYGQCLQIKTHNVPTVSFNVCSRSLHPFGERCFQLKTYHNKAVTMGRPGGEAKGKALGGDMSHLGVVLPREEDVAVLPLC